MNSHRRQAFTLVELLVVITIIGMLVALLLPAVNSARESARQTTCMNNQRNFGEAIQQYVTTKDYFPGYRSLIPYGGAKSAIINWQIALLPNMGKTDVYQSIRDGSLTELPYWETSVCPSDNTVSGRSKPWTSYVANTGMLDNPTPAITPSLKPVDLGANGIFHDFAKAQPLVVKLSLTDIKSGQATTLMFTENVDAYWYGESPFANAVINGTPQSNTPVGTPNNNSTLAVANNSTERGTGFQWWDTSTSGAAPTNPSVAPLNKPQAAINGQKGDWDPGTKSWPTSATDPNVYAARPASYHPGGVIVAFAGANTRFLKDDIDYALYCRLMVTDARNVFTAYKGNPLQPKSWMQSYQIDEGQF